MDRVNRTSKACGPFITFIWGTLVSLFAYGKKRIRLRVDDGDERTVDVLNIAIANGRYHGGGMLVAPDAVTDDGLFHVTVIGAMSLPLVFWHLPKLYTGKIKRIRQVSMPTGKRVIASSEQRVLLDIDGEQPGTLPAELAIVPGAINMIMKEPPDPDDNRLPSTSTGHLMKYSPAVGEDFTNTPLARHRIALCQPEDNITFISQLFNPYTVSVSSPWHVHCCIGRQSGKTGRKEGLSDETFSDHWRLASS